MAKPEIKIVKSEQFRLIPTSSVVITHTPYEFRIAMYSDYPELNASAKVESVERVREVDITLSHNMRGLF